MWTLACLCDFDYVDEDVIHHAEIDGGKLVFGQNEYRVMVLPGVTMLSQETLERICRFAEGGGKVIAYRCDIRHRADAGPVHDLHAAAQRLERSPAFVRTADEAELRKAMGNAGEPNLTVEPATSDVDYQHQAHLHRLAQIQDS
jgi:hypothetical protein